MFASAVYGIAGLVAAAVLWFLWPVLTAWQTKRTPDHESERTFVDPSSGAKTAFPSISDAPSVLLSLIVPAYNEEERIPEMLEETLAHLAGRAASDRCVWRLHPRSGVSFADSGRVWCRGG